MIVPFLLFSTRSAAQSLVDAYRYTSNDQVGTARNVAVGGVMGSLGADFSVVSTNPAGLGRYKSTEFGITGNFVFGNTAGSYLSNTFDDDFFNFNLSHAGGVFIKQMNSTRGWRNINFGAGINRLNHYNDDIYLSGTNTSASLLDQHAFIATGTDPELLPEFYPYDAGLSYLGDLIQSDSVFNYTSVLGNTAPDQQIAIRRRGGKYEMAVAGSGNFKDKLYVGASIGIPILRFEEKAVIAEQDGANAVEGFNFFDFETRLRTTGIGVNFKTGFLAKPHHLIRFGAAFHSPTYLKLDDEYFNLLFSDFDSIAYTVESPDGVFTYNLVLPWKFLANGAVLLDRFGFVGIEYELTNPARSSLKFKSSGFDLTDEENMRNDQIAEAYDWQHHIKTGLEIKLDPIRLRAGFQYKTTGIKDNDDDQVIWSGGIGYRGKHFFVDGTYSFSTNTSVYTPYEVGNVSSSAAELDHTRSQVMITVGAKL
jgi:hypothetical protein